MALGTVRLLGLPIDDKGLQVIALACPSLPAIGPKGRPDDIDGMLGLGCGQEVRIENPFGKGGMHSRRRRLRHRGQGLRVHGHSLPSHTRMTLSLFTWGDHRKSEYDAEQGIR
jgi:hypothetical protein